MAVRKVLQLGDPRLYEVSAPVRREQIPDLKPLIQDLHDTLLDFRAVYGAGRCLAAPQIGVPECLVYMHIETPTVFLNPVIEPLGSETMEVWDDCVSFPDLLVKVERYCRCRIVYRDTDWYERAIELEGDLSELLQHEVDHLDGVLAVARAIDAKSFALRSEQRHTDYDRSALAAAAIG